MIGRPSFSIFPVPVAIRSSTLYAIHWIGGMRCSPSAITCHSGEVVARRPAADESRDFINILKFDQGETLSKIRTDHLLPAP